MKIAMLVDTFPEISETFVLRQVVELIDRGYEVDIYADAAPEHWYSGDRWREDEGARRKIHSAYTQPEIATHRLLENIRYARMPIESLFEQPVYPLLTGKTWAGDRSVLNWTRLLRVVPVLLRCSYRAGLMLTATTLRSSHYHFHATSLSALYRLDALCRAGKQYDIIHAQFGPIAARNRFARTLWKAPLVANFRGYDFSSFPRANGRTYYKRLFEDIDAAVTDNEYAREKVVELGCAGHKTYTIPSAFDVNHFQYREHVYTPGEPVNLLSVARLVEKKGLEYSIRALSCVTQDFPQLRYDIIGDGPLQRSLNELVKSLGLEGKVVFHGARDKEFVREKMHAAHILLFTSVTAQNGDQEGQGVVLQEAQASGLPVIVSKHGGLPESILPGKSGLLVPERDTEAIASQLRFLLENPDMWKKMGEEGRDFVEKNFSSVKINQKWDALYSGLIARFHNTSPDIN